MKPSRQKQQPQQEDWTVSNNDYSRRTVRTAQVTTFIPILFNKKETKKERKKEMKGEKERSVRNR